MAWGRASIWMVGSTLLDEKPVEFLRASIAWVDTQKKLYHTLSNIVDGRNTKHIEWLRWLGFTINPAPCRGGPPGIPFYNFHWTREKDTEECASQLSPP